MTEALSGAWNFRDIAEGTGLRPGRFFRSSELSGLDADGQRALLGLGISDVADLRSPREVERHGPGSVPDTVTVHRLPFPDLSASPDDSGFAASSGGGQAPHDYSFTRLFRDESGDEPVDVAAARYMTEEYERFPTLGGAKRAVAQIVSLLAAGRTVITHCFAGKDRTGFAVAVVLEALGVDRDAILADYLRSNAAVPSLRERILATMRERGGDEMTPEALAFAEAKLTEAVLGVREDYLAAARRGIHSHYGSLTGYLESAGVTAEQLRALTHRLR
ncbi:tyrosine-protein phosphatase [Mycobacterium sp. MYCO198283]|uniref:tyrosine-protein phosphatase n=1 Tax=Mycobacterium sp. MYCO198283 TaxID=2883505 RepID=UPI001E4F8611|nr:tyrosine-protein phosphatase [Mycobacterium sp. MYCO198283]MCG5434496.1 tyrosine-protein phosphatase [Mycobacterium sp. MYCO198283]